MLKHVVEMQLPGARADGFFSFMANPADEVYRDWLPEEHFAFHIEKKGRDTPLGDLIYYDEHLGTQKHRLVFYARVTVAERPGRIVYRMRRFGLPLPGYLDICFRDTPDGLALRHEVRIGWRGIGSLIDPILKRFFDDAFFEALEGHCHREWTRLAELLSD